MMCSESLFLLTCCALASASPGWPGQETSDGVHLFTLWSQQSLNDSEIGAFDFVWSMEDDADLVRYRAAGAQRAVPAVLSRYVPFGIASSGEGDSNRAFSNLTWWQEHHPTWLLYRCDRKTPATYWGPGLGLDISNPDVLDYMLHGDAAHNSRSAAAVASAGYDSVSLDLFSFGNWFRACGAYDAAGEWRQLYSNATDDAAYKRDVLAWLGAYYAGLQSIRGRDSGRRLLLVPNFASHVGNLAPGFWGDSAWNSTDMFFVGNHTDGILSEEGFTGYGGGLVGGADWVNKFLFAQNLQDSGKAYFSVNYWGPKNVQTHAPAPVNTSVEDYFLASYLVAKGSASALHFGPNQCSYGPPCTCGGWCDHRSLHFFGRTLTPAVGAPASRARELDGGVWAREMAAGLALVNPNAAAGAARNVTLDPSFSYQDRAGRVVPATVPLRLPPLSGAVLLRTKKNF